MGIVAKYKFDGSVYADLIPEFNPEFTDYTITDEVDSENSNHIIRTIESKSLPTQIYFGLHNSSNVATDKEASLLSIEYLDVSQCTNLAQLCRYCYNLESVNCGDWDTRNVENMLWLFEGCNKLKVIDVRNWDTSKCTKIGAIFSGCTSLTSLDLSLWDTSKVINLMYLFASCISLATLDISNMVILEDSSLEGFLTVGCTSLKYIKCNILNTIQKISSKLPTRTADNPGVIIYQGAETLPQETIDTLNSKGWTVNTNPTLIAKYKYDSKIYKNLIPAFNEGYMGFVEDEEIDANGVVTRVIEHVELPTYVRFGYNDTIKNTYSYAYKDIQYVNCTKINNINYMFRGCTSLINLDVSNWNLNKITSCHTSFADCISMTSIIGLDMIDVSEVTSFAYMFSACKTLQKLDISNFKFKSDVNLRDMFNNTPLLTDIGMLYCDQSTINKVASLLPTDHNITIWVESDDILQYDQYDHITYKTQKVQDTVHLNSPLLKGDTIEVIDGKTYHVHRWEKVVLDGSQPIYTVKNHNVNSDLAYFIYSCFDDILKDQLNDATKIFSDRFVSRKLFNEDTNDLAEGVCSTFTTAKLRFLIFKSKLSTVDINGVNKWLSENPTTVIFFRKTPYYELISEEPLELTLLDTTDNTINNNSILPSNMTIANKELSTIAIKPSTTYTLSFDKSNEDSEVTIDICGGEQITTVLNRIELTTPSELGSGIRFISSDGCIISNVRLLEGSLVKEAIPKETFEGLKSSFEDGYIIGDFLGTANSMTLINTKNETQASDDIINLSKFIKAKNPITLIFNTDIANSNVRIGCYGEKGIGSGFYNNIDKLDKIGLTKYLIIPMIDIVSIRLVNHDSDSTKIGDMAKISNVVVLEGDHTHLSEAELMRYIEKGTSHYEEEDYNHVGKYKVQYKVTGKNKFDGSKSIFSSNYNSYTQCFKVNPNTTYTYNSSYTGHITLGCYKEYNAQHPGDSSNNGNILFNQSVRPPFTITTPSNCNYMWLNHASMDDYFVQLEEGTVATEYEPYKEDIKTYYLSSPLLEGDTIEDINGVATHVKRYEKVVLDGSKNWVCDSYSPDKYGYYGVHEQLSKDAKLQGKMYSNNFRCYRENIDTQSNGEKLVSGLIDSYGVILILKASRLQSYNNEGIKQWLSENPTTVVYELASPIYEPISTESILCDSYVNGHLDVDTDIPIEKVEFRCNFLPLKYTSSQTYTVQFEADNDGFIDYWMIEQGGTKLNLQVHKGINRFTLRGGDTKYPCMYISGIGFNASNIQVVATDRDVEFDYFKGLQSSFEDGLITNENDENYGKYKVECKVIGKNKFDINKVSLRNITSHTTSNINNNIITITTQSGGYGCSLLRINLRKGVYILSCNTEGSKSSGLRVNVHGDYTHASNPHVFEVKYEDIVEIYFYSGMPTAETRTTQITNIQLEEGTQATSYEPYKESIHTLYLNSPLLKGDKLVVHDGKLCHYHKMGMVVLDGSKDEYWSKAGIYIPFIVIRNVGLKPNGNMGHDSTKGKMHTNILQPNIITSTTETDNRKGIYVVGSGEYNEIRIRLTDNDTVNSVKQWLQQNPTTVVYELAEPYYEPIEPQLSQYSFSTVKDGDMEIITVLPIEKVNLTYRTDINGVSSIEEQIASIQEGTDISSIIDEEVDE